LKVLNHFVLALAIILFLLKQTQTQTHTELLITKLSNSELRTISIEPCSPGLWIRVMLVSVWYALTVPAACTICSAQACLSKVLLMWDPLCHRLALLWSPSRFQIRSLQWLPRVQTFVVHTSSLKSTSPYLHPTSTSLRIDCMEWLKIETHVKISSLLLWKFQPNQKNQTNHRKHSRNNDKKQKQKKQCY